ncbi:hypothetical protein T06_9545 [Trichinella sp. T6]|nr:hypothetical protein T06_9545 [Trichinella sp. T6]
MVGNWHSRQELRYRSSKQRLRWFKLCFDCNTRKTLIYGWRALLQHKMWESGRTSWVHCSAVYTSIQAFPIADIASLIALAKLKNTIGDLILPLTGGNGRGILGGNVGMPFGNSGRLLGGGNYYGPNSGGILENLGSRFLGGGGLMNGMEERPLVGMLNNLLGGRNQGLLGRNNFRNRNGFDTPKGYDYYD